MKTELNALAHTHTHTHILYFDKYLSSIDLTPFSGAPMLKFNIAEKYFFQAKHRDFRELGHSPSLTV
jgi:hypothetical protein